MGLAGAKNKRKLGTDPNNTKWLRNTGSFGHKLLRAQGWQPGENLGAKDAPHAEFHTDASASHIRVVLKEDNLGLGAKRNNGDECTGLDAFQDLLGRLNGKSDEAIEGERKARSDLKLSLYVERKLGTIRFVSGGLLVGDEMKKKDDEVDQQTSRDDTPLSPEKTEDSEGQEEVKKSKKSKKRKAEAEDATGDVSEGGESKRSKKRRKEKDGELDSGDGSLKRSKKDKKTRKEEKKKRSKKSSSVPDDEDGVIRSESEADRTASASARPKKSKDKARRKGGPSTDSQAAEEDEKSSKKKKKRRKDDEDSASSASTIEPKAVAPTENTTVSTPATSGYSTPTQDATMRHYSRKRMIAQKQMALADPTALAQIFMIKSQP